MDAWLIDALKKYPCAKLEGGLLRTCPVRLSFAQHLFVAQEGMMQDDGKKGPPKFSATLLFPKGADISVLVAAAKEARDAKFGSNYVGPKLHTPFRDQSEKGHLDGYEEGAIFFAASSTKQPGVVVAVPGAKPKPATAAEVYSGCWALVTLNAYGFKSAKKSGVSLGLNNVMKIRDGESFSSRSQPESDFGDIEVTSDFNVDDLMG